jgi:hypothetical protein
MYEVAQKAGFVQNTEVRGVLYYLYVNRQYHTGFSRDYRRQWDNEPRICDVPWKSISNIQSYMKKRDNGFVEIQGGYHRRQGRESAASPSSEGDHGDLFEALHRSREVCLDIESCPVGTIE